MQLRTRFQALRSFVLAAAMLVAANAVQAAVPSPWVAQDVGAPSPVGSSSYDAGTLTISASGVDIWGTSDQFHFVYQQVSGDVEVIARIGSLSPTNAWAKAGVMFRSSLSGSSPEVLTAVTAGNGVAFQHRATSGQTSVIDGVVSGLAAPRWVRLVRTGDTVTAYHATDSAQWTKINSITLPLGTSIYVGLAVTSHSSGIVTTATVTNASIKSSTSSGGNVPSPQKAGDIGTPAIAGSTTYASDVYTINAGGTDIWGTSDQFHYVYQPMNGDGEIVAHVAGLGAADVWSKAGVMVRESLAANSRYAFALVSVANGYAFQRRIDTGGYSTVTAGGTGAAPGWVRLVRTGYKFEAFRSADGSTWTSMGSDTVAMADQVYVGIAVTSHNATLGTTAKVDNLKITSASSSTNQPPVVSLTSPTAGATFTGPATIALTASASDPEYRLSHVDFYAGSTLLNSNTSAPYSFSWSSVPAGSYSLTAVATDADGGRTTSAPVSVTVSGQSSSDTQAPAAPTGVAAAAASSSQINLTWTASADNVGVAGYRIERCQGAGCTTFAQVGTSTAAAYSATGLTASTSYSFRVRATDAAGNVGGYSNTASTTTQSGQTAAPIAYVQVNSTVPQSPTAAPALPFNAAQTAGNLNVVVVGWNDATANVQSVADSVGNTYALAVGPTVHSSGFGSQSIYYAKNIKSAAAGGNVVTVTFDQPAQSPDIRIAEYRGVDTTSPVDVKVAAQGDSASSSSGAVTTTSAHDLLVGANLSAVGLTTGAGTSFTRRVITSPDGDILEDRIVTATGSYSAAAPLSASGPWIMQMVAFRAAGSAPAPAPSDTQAPTAPASLAATAASSSQINLTWTASTDNTGVASYFVERCQGTGCTTFAQVGTSATASYSVSGLSVSTSYSFRVRATDAAGNMSAYSTVATATASGSSSTTTPKQVVFTASSDHSTSLVTGYRLDVFAAGANPSTDTAVASADLGKPAPATNGDITVDRATFFSALASGNYQATVSAYGPGGTTRSTVVNFAR
jgi:regulation of enolase protein 1 (concanavalin A-like superfamily)